MKEFDEPIIDEEKINSAKKNKMIILSVLILGIIFIIKLKETAVMLMLFTLPYVFSIFIISFFIIVMKNSELSKKKDVGESLQKDVSNPQLRQSEVREVNENGLRKLKTLGSIVFSYILLCIITYIMTLVNSLFIYF